MKERWCSDPNCQGQVHANVCMKCGKKAPPDDECKYCRRIAKYFHERHTGNGVERVGFCDAHKPPDSESWFNDGAKPRR